MKKRVFLSMMALFLAVIVVSPAYPQAYPSKPLSILVAYAAGGETDIGARIVASIAEKDLGQPIIVINKGGAGGQIGWTELAKQKPDGYYIGFVNPPGLNSVILDPERKATFTLDHFVPIINQVVDPVCFYVKPESPYKSFKDLLEDAGNAPRRSRSPPQASTATSTWASYYCRTPPRSSSESSISTGAPRSTPP